MKRYSIFKQKESFMHKIILTEFSNRIALEMGLRIIELAQERHQRIAVEVSRLNHSVFLYVDDHLAAEKIHWLKRKANLTRLFEESSLQCRLDCEARGMSLQQRFGLDNQEYALKGGAIPIFVENAGMVGTVAVSGLTDVEDHQIIVDALADVLN